APSYEAHAQEEKKPPAEKKPVKELPAADCEIKTIEIECEHNGRRKFKVKAPPDPKAKPPSNVIEVVAANPSHAEKVKTTIVWAKPRCATHKPHALTVKAPTVNLTKAEDTSTVEVFHSEQNVH